MKSMIVIPTYNERDTIEKLTRQTLGVNGEFSVTIIDDNSPDGTGQIAERLAREDSRVHVVHRPAKLGMGTAYVDGFQYALRRNMDCIFEMDSDMSHYPAYLQNMLAAVEDADMVIASRYCEGGGTCGWPRHRLLFSRCANLYASHLIGLPITDCTSGLRCYRREILQRIDLRKVRSRGFAFQIEMLAYVHRLGCRIKEIPIMFRERAGGCSKLTWQVIWEAFWVVNRLGLRKALPRGVLRTLPRSLAATHRDASTVGDSRGASSNPHGGRLVPGTCALREPK